MVNSMTGFAALKGECEGWTWAWDMRAVNARGLDIRMRLPDWLVGLEQPVRSAISSFATRGNITLGLRMNQAEGTKTEAIDADILARLMSYIKSVEQAADGAGVTVVSATALDLLAFRGVLSSQVAEDDPAPLVKMLIAQLPELTAAFQDMRAHEGAALAEVLTGQLDKIATLTDQAEILAEARKDQWNARLHENLARVLDNSDGADPARIAQELAIIAVKSDVTEEVDRLRAHVIAARELLTSHEAMGRKLDFLSQEFNREANTLCAKAQSTDLTSVGLDLKATIDQMREQVQNVE